MPARPAHVTTLLFSIAFEACHHRTPEPTAGARDGGVQVQGRLGVDSGNDAMTLGAGSFLDGGPARGQSVPHALAEAGADAQTRTDMLLGIPGTERPTEQRLFVIPASRAREAGYERAEGYWTPSFQEVRGIDERLPRVLADQARDPRAPTIAPRVAAYQAQFIGLVRSGKRRVLGNYMCTQWIEVTEAQHPGRRFDFEMYWLNDVQDGGVCFFHFWYDPADKSIHDLSINGEG
jgi:hypothetical protein